jgi:hypothetical protein
MNFNVDIISLVTTGSLDSNSNVVTLANYNITASEGIYFSSGSYSQYFPPPMGSFTDYDTLTEGQVKAWVTGSPQYLVQLSPLETDIWDQKQTIQDNLPWN